MQGVQNGNVWDVQVFENNNGANGALVETIAQNDWDRLAFYAPKVVF